MAITGSSASYIPTMDEFLGHWNNVNTTLGVGNELVLVVKEAALDRAGFAGLRGGLVAQEADIQDKLNDLEIARADIELKKAQLLSWFSQFKGLLDAYYVGTKFYAARPNAPSLRDGREAFTRPLYDAASLWTKLNQAPARPGLALPIVLSDGATTRDMFAAALAALEAVYILAAEHEQNLTLSRMDRNAVQADAYEAMKMYRQAVPSRCAQHPSLVATLPRLTPEPGSTPDPLAASAVFVPPDQSKVVHAAVVEPGIKKVQLRGHVGTKWDDDLAVTLAEHAPDTVPPEFVTTFGLTQPGASAVFKVYVVNQTDNEAGSAPLQVTRPA